MSSATSSAGRPVTFASRAWNLQSVCRPLLALRGDLIGSAGQLRGRSREPKRGVRGGGALIGGGRDADGGTTHLPLAVDAHRGVGCVEDVDEHEGRLERAVGAAQDDIDRIVTGGVQRP